MERKELDEYVKSELKGEGFDDPEQDQDEKARILSPEYLVSWYQNFSNLAKGYSKGKEDDRNYFYWNAYYTGRAETYKSLLREFFPDEWRKIDDNRKGG